MKLTATDIAIGLTIIVVLLTSGGVWVLQRRRSQRGHTMPLGADANLLQFLPPCLLAVLVVALGTMWARTRMERAGGAHPATDPPPISDRSPAASEVPPTDRPAQGPTESAAPDATGRVNAVTSPPRAALPPDEFVAAEPPIGEYARQLGEYQQRFNRLSTEYDLVRQISKERQTQLNELSDRVQYIEQQLQARLADLAERDQQIRNLRDRLAQVGSDRQRREAARVETTRRRPSVARDSTVNETQQWDDRGWYSVPARAAVGRTRRFSPHLPAVTHVTSPTANFYPGSVTVLGPPRVAVPTTPIVGTLTRTQPPVLYRGY